MKRAAFMRTLKRVSPRRPSPPPSPTGIMLVPGGGAEATFSVRWYAVPCGRLVAVSSTGRARGTTEDAHVRAPRFVWPYPRQAQPTGPADIKVALRRAMVRFRFRFAASRGRR